MDKDLAISLTDEEWEKSIIPELVEYIRVPNKSPAFDPDWQSNGFMEQVVDQFVAWSQHQNIEGMELDVIRLPKRTPLIFIDIPGDTENTVLLYGHLDKQPEMMGWNEGFGPWKPVLKENKLYGRGGADDGYALFASLLAIKILHKQKIPHARCVVIIEACEESGSYDLPFYIDHLKDRLGKPELVICLDSGCGNYEQLWSTTSLRGLVGGELKVEVLDEGIHSGDISGIIPSSFRILRQLLDRIEDPVSGQILLKECYVDIPNKRIEQAKHAASVLNENVFRRFPIKGNVRPVSDDLVELILNRSWRPTLSYLGASGLPEINDAGNVLRPFTSIKLSMRLPPTCSSKIVSKKLKELLLNDPPNGAKISFEIDWSVDGWMAPEISPWLEKALDEASENYFNKPSVHIGEGWSIPFMGMLGEKFPEAQFLITGVLGPGSNAHGPNEFLHIPAAKKITCCVAEIIAKHYQAYKKL
ncbi:MAG: peptidase M20 [Legionellales bacterium]|jgi:acetylornithine deacetylase/succinyl-diaminopimelate desuccinylase-like protein|nr:peptidase M20 [Legionellales bacterium]HBH10134.1 peptidase M20 [Gammaproteobacteria bacterium]|tara:strand:- start:1307 stop:2725 length:1419 start_codon:yes stop_codon:yes gene_type:complete